MYELIKNMLMSAQYDLYETPDPANTGEQKPLHARIVPNGTYSKKEFMLLYKMVSFPGKIFTRQQLMDDIWGYDSASDAHTVDVHIGRLRERFRDNPDFKIMTIRGVGYKVIKA